MKCLVIVSVVLFAVVKCRLILEPSQDITVKSRLGGLDLCFRGNCGQPLFLTPLLQKDIERAKKLARVYPDIGGTTSYSGYFTVNQRCNSNLFFWFFPAQENWENAPLVLWLQGGPGGSSLFGLFEEIGPLTYNHTTGRRRHAWNVKNNLIFIDQPVGTGFSFSERSCYASDESTVAKDLHEALVQFYTLFPNLQKNKFIITGESYAGHYIPAIGYEIHTKNQYAKVKINLSGMMIGNGWMEKTSQENRSRYLYEHGLIDYNAMQKGMVRTSPRINPYNYLEFGQPEDLYPEFLNKPAIRRSLHVGNKHFDDINMEVYAALYFTDTSPIRHWVEELLEHYPMVFYNGQLDTVCPHPLVAEFLQSLHWSGATEYNTVPRYGWCVGDKLAGFFKSAGNLHEVMIRNAGHMVPKDQPLWAYILMDSVTSNLLSPMNKLKPCT